MDNNICQHKGYEYYKHDVSIIISSAKILSKEFSDGYLNYDNWCSLCKKDSKMCNCNGLIIRVLYYNENENRILSYEYGIFIKNLMYRVLFEKRLKVLFENEWISTYLDGKEYKDFYEFSKFPDLVQNILVSVRVNDKQKEFKKRAKKLIEVQEEFEMGIGVDQKKLEACNYEATKTRKIFEKYLKMYNWKATEEMDDCINYDRFGTDFNLIVSYTNYYIDNCYNNIHFSIYNVGNKTDEYFPEYDPKQKLNLRDFVNYLGILDKKIKEKRGY